MHNPTSELQAYKIKTTAPRLYCVRPNSSAIPPGESIEVSIIRQAKDKSKVDDQRKDKFLILSTVIKEAPQDQNYADLWASLEKSTDSSITSHKIRVKYTSNADATAADEEIPPPAPKVAPPAPPDDLSNGQQEKLDKEPVNEEKTVNVAPKSEPAAETTMFETPVKAFSSNTGTEVEKASQKAREKISNLSKEIKNDRMTSSSPSPTPAVARQKGGSDIQNGVPVHFVLLLAVVAFFIGWKLF